MKLTKETAIILTYQLWKWMQDNDEISKYKWPGWKVYGSMECKCPCCEYEDQQHLTMEKRCVEHCPLIEIWPTELVTDDVPCYQPGSPYRNFDDFLEDKKATEVVNKMVSAIEGEMKRLGIKNREIKP